MLVRPEGRTLLHALKTTRYAKILQFQCSSAPKDGRYDVARGFSVANSQLVSMLVRPEGRTLPNQHASLKSPSFGFNARPPRRTDATVPTRTYCLVQQLVSMLVRPEGRTLLAFNCWFGTRKVHTFQCSSAPKDGRYEIQRSGR